ncbi:hypothetical protein CPLU01_08750 [Colletotrichum plurivorum]|uniref:Uncharacterized protein n=1 Tax=Colletotrichum plurivorum TaxID=2175906 RepID=A0A8H6KAC6_9PEZI|nr:hypothetical protein CPLU01_08750 [Colletotrichum plurivorum]
MGRARSAIQSAHSGRWTILEGDPRPPGDLLVDGEPRAPRYNVRAYVLSCAGLLIDIRQGKSENRTTLGRAPPRQPRSRPACDVAFMLLFTFLRQKKQIEGKAKGICVAEPTGGSLEGFKVVFCAPVDPPHSYLSLTSRRDERPFYEFPNLMDVEGAPGGFGTGRGLPGMARWLMSFSLLSDAPRTPENPGHTSCALLPDRVERDSSAFSHRRFPPLGLLSDHGSIAAQHEPQGGGSRSLTHDTPSAGSWKEEARHWGRPQASCAVGETEPLMWRSCVQLDGRLARTMALTTPSPCTG